MRSKILQDFYEKMLNSVHPTFPEYLQAVQDIYTFHLDEKDFRNKEVLNLLTHNLTKEEAENIASVYNVEIYVIWQKGDIFKLNSSNNIVNPLSNITPELLEMMENIQALESQTEEQNISENPYQNWAVYDRVNDRGGFDIYIYDLLNNIEKGLFEVI